MISGSNTAQPRRACLAVIGLACVLTGCEEPQPTSFAEFMDDEIARDGTLARCNEDRESTATDIECANARRAAAAIALREERARREALELESERKLAALREQVERERAAAREAQLRAEEAARAAYDAQWESQNAARVGVDGQPLVEGEAIGVDGRPIPVDPAAAQGADITDAMPPAMSSGVAPDSPDGSVSPQ